MLERPILRVLILFWLQRGDRSILDCLQLIDTGCSGEPKTERESLFCTDSANPAAFSVVLTCLN